MKVARSEVAKGIPLVKLKRWPTLKRFFEGRFVRIFSAEYFLWWRGNCAGYTVVESEAGVYTFEQAWEASAHCDPSKGIVYQVAQEEFSI